MNTPTDMATPPEPQFEAYVRRVRIGTFVICLVAIPIGVALANPWVWGLATAGVVVHGVRWLQQGNRYFWRPLANKP